MKAPGASARSRRFRWIVVFVYVALIYTTIPYTSRLWSEARYRLDVQYATLAFYLLAPAGLIVALIALRATRFQPWRVAALAACGGVYYGLYGNIFQTPGEKIHLLEYGLLSFIILWAVDNQLVPPGRLYLARRVGLALLLAFLFGIWDETIQNYIPARHYDLRDIWINWLSSILGMIVCLLMRRNATTDRARVVPAAD
ncbi:MAG: VanZ family protein [Acidobacteriota bacterium]